MTPEQETYIRLGAYVLGWALSIAWPFILARVADGAAFDWRMIVGRILAGLIGLVGFLAGDEAVAMLGGLSYVAAFLAGFGASQAGREVQKTTDAAGVTGKK